MSDTKIISQSEYKRILITDDAGPVSEALLGLLVRRGHSVEVVPDGRCALHQYAPGKYDLVITDYVMPGMNGLELAKIIREQDPGQRVLLITAFAFSLAAGGAQGLPVDSVLRKPFTLAELQAALTDIFSRPAHASAAAPVHQDKE